MYNVSIYSDQILNRSISEMVGSDFYPLHPSANAVEHDDNFQIILAVPSLEKSDFSISVDKTNSSFPAEKRKSGTSGKKLPSKGKEFNYSSFKRNFTLPETVDNNRIKAEYTTACWRWPCSKRKQKRRSSKDHSRIGKIVFSWVLIVWAIGKDPVAFLFYQKSPL